MTAVAAGMLAAVALAALAAPGPSGAEVRSTRSSPRSTFTIAVMPDTQQEVLRAGDTRLGDRSRWLVAHRAALDLRFVTHTGDVVNWDTPDHGQTRIASDAMRPLEAARIPYSLSIGNHDTQATGVGGGARDPDNTPAQQRDTSVFNSFFTAARYGAVKGAFEPGKVDNIYSTFSADGTRWLVLNLELWPRVAVVSWARSVVASHPDDNVIIATHSYMTSGGGIYTGHDYGDTSGQYLFDHLVKVYPNVKLVFSGHTGLGGQRTDVGVHGNKIVSYLQTFHSRLSNPVRLVQIDTAEGTIHTRIYVPSDSVTWDAYSDVQTKMTWVRPAS